MKLGIFGIIRSAFKFGTDIMSDEKVIEVAKESEKPGAIFMEILSAAFRKLAN